MGRSSRSDLSRLRHRVGGNHATKVATMAVPSAYSGHFGALAEFERDLIQERTHAGLASATAAICAHFGPRQTVDLANTRD